MAKIIKCIELPLYERLMEIYGKEAGTYEPARNIEITSPTPSNEPPNGDSLEIKDIVQYLCQYQKSKAEKLLLILRQLNLVSWQPNFEVLIKKSLIPDSNIVDLVSFVTRKIFPTAKQKPPPIGINQFLKVIAEANIPSGLLTIDKEESYEEPIKQRLRKKKHERIKNQKGGKSIKWGRHYSGASVDGKFLRNQQLSIFQRR
jgi:hypothetical protein